MLNSNKDFMMSLPKHQKLATRDSPVPHQRKVISNYIEELPNELVQKILLFMELQEWVSFLEAFPKYRGLSKYSYLRRTVLTHADSVDRDMEVLFHPEGYDLMMHKMSLDEEGFMTPLADLDLVPNLQCIKLKCWDLSGIYSDIFYETDVWKKFLVRGKSVIFDDCQGFRSLTDHKAKERWRIFLEKFIIRKGYRKDFGTIIENVVFCDSLILRDCWDLMLQIVLLLTTACTEFEASFVVQVKNDNEDITMNRQSFTMDDRNVAYYRIYYILREILKQENLQEARKCEKFQIKRNKSKNLIVCLTHDIDIDTFKNDFNKIKEESERAFPDHISTNEGATIQALMKNNVIL